MRIVDVPAGFTAFLPLETKLYINDGPYRTSVQAVENHPAWGLDCDENEENGKREKDTKKLGLNVVLHNGTTLVQGTFIQSVPVACV